MQRLGTKALSHTLWTLLQELARSKTRWQPTQVVQLAHALTACVALRAVSVRAEDKILYRMIMVVVLTRGASDLSCVERSLRKELRQSMGQLAVSFDLCRADTSSDMKQSRL